MRTASGVFRTLEVEETGRFSNRLKALRQSLIGKQAALAIGVGCTEAAVSYWETGRRLPSQPMLVRILETLKDHGCETPELDDLAGQWQVEVVGRDDGSLDTEWRAGVDGSAIKRALPG